MKALFTILYILLLFQTKEGFTQGHYITFCGEYVPMEQEYVADRLMNSIKKLISTVGGVELRKRADYYFPFFENVLSQYGVPTDFKYLAIVESRLLNLTSPVGAQGVWQIMPATAREFKLNPDGPNDERNDTVKATHAAAKILIRFYKTIFKYTKRYSWILTAASYNAGPGGVHNSVKRSGTTDYFALKINAETAAYVYRIIAVKELFEHPEIYMKKNFGYNIFSASNQNRTLQYNDEDEKVTIDERKWNLESRKKVIETKSEHPFAARLLNNFNTFEDGDNVVLQLEEPISTSIGFFQKGTKLGNSGYFIDGRLYIDLGYGAAYEVCDLSGQKGIEKDELRKNLPVSIIVTTRDLK